MTDLRQPELTGTLARLWQRVGPPLRPSAGDCRLFQQTLSDWADKHPGAAAPRALILGATTELWDLDWPCRDRIVVLEPDAEVAAEAWQGPADVVQVRSWLTLDDADGRFDIVLCDAGLHTLGYPNEQAELRQRIANVTASGALVAFRLFCPPSRHESTVKVTSELWAGHIGNMSELMLRLAMSMQRSPPAGVRIDTVWLKLRSLCKDWATLAVRTGWDAEDVTIADLYRSSPAKYHFSGLVEILDRFGYSDGQDFQMVRLATGGGPLAAQCPVVTFERL